VPFGDADIPSLYKDFGESFTIGSTTALGLWNEGDPELLNNDFGTLRGRVTTVQLQTSAWAGLLVEGATITRVSTATAYRINGTKRLEPDGLETLVEVAIP
jgi:hypothetical protein